MRKGLPVPALAQVLVLLARKGLLVPALAQVLMLLARKGLMALLSLVAPLWYHSDGYAQAEG